MFGLTISCRFRVLASLWLAGSFVVIVIMNAVDAAVGHQSVIRMTLTVGVAALFLAIGLFLMRVRKSSLDLVEVHTELKRTCAELANGRDPYCAVDDSRKVAVYIIKTRRLLLANYQVAVGELGDDWDYDAATMRNIHFLTVTFYSLSPGVADVRKFVEAAALRGDGDVTFMDDPAKQNGIRQAFEVVRAPRELNFATTAELREVLMILDEAKPFEPTGAEGGTPEWP
jgi:hypothetical protein